MGVFYVDCEIENPILQNSHISVKKVLVDTGAEYTWIPKEILKKIKISIKKNLQFIMANGDIITRDVGYAIIRAEGFETIDEVVFAEDKDLSILGSRTLEGFPAIVDARHKKLVIAGPLSVA